jgi:hypothetical protein
VDSDEKEPYTLHFFEADVSGDYPKANIVLHSELVCVRQQKEQMELVGDRRKSLCVYVSNYLNDREHWKKGRNKPKSFASTCRSLTMKESGHPSGGQ